MTVIRLAFVALIVCLAQADAAETLHFVRGGRPLAVRMPRTPWRLEPGHIRGRGRDFLLAARGVEAGDFRVTARLRLGVNSAQSGAGFRIGYGFFGLSSTESSQIFVNGKLFGGYQDLGPSDRHFKLGDWFELEVVSRAGKLELLLNGKIVFERPIDAKRFFDLGFTPWRGVVDLSDFSVLGRTFELPRPSRLGYSIPVVDLADQKYRQVVVDREAGQYLGHPTTVLLEDDKTLLCVYPKGHGGGGIVLKRSRDGGLTWSERLPVPGSWATSREVPTIFRMTDPMGKKRLVLFSGLYPIRMSSSEDDGDTWTPLTPIGDFGGIVAMSSVERLETGEYMALFHDDGRFLHAGHNHLVPRFRVYKVLSTDGGCTWSQPQVVTEDPVAHLCEPGLVRSPGGNQIAVLLRENSRRLNSFVITSDDEGKTWSKPRQMSDALTGDRHTARYAPDGRLFVSFRDTSLVSRTRGDWVAWVGKYQDIIEGHEGQYRVRLMDNHRGLDCAYPAVELLPDGTFVATTYGHWARNEKPFIVSVRLKMNELDELAERLKDG